MQRAAAVLSEKWSGWNDIRGWNERSASGDKMCIHKAKSMSEKAKEKCPKRWSEMKSTIQRIKEEEKGGCLKTRRRGGSSGRPHSHVHARPGRVASSPRGRVSHCCVVLLYNSAC
jgi:hypothetical protein